jgi:hypothetical protein
MDLTVFTEVCTITGERASSAARSTLSRVRWSNTLNASTPYLPSKAFLRP